MTDTDHKAAEERVRAFVARATENLADPNWRPSRANYEAARNHCSTLLSRLSEVEGERDEAHRYLDRLEQARTEGEGEGDEVLTLKGRILNLDSERRAAIMERDAALASIPATTGDA
jgi:hypothetical protein